MKKVVRLFSLLFLVVFMSGCVKYDIGMEVGSDKSVTISFISAIDKDYSDLSDTSESDTETAEAKGFTAEDYEDDDYVGTKLTKKFDSIDSISTSDDIVVELTDIIDEDKDDIEVYFQKKTSLFKTTYIATFTVDMSDDSSSYSSYSSMFDLTYHVTLPVEADSNNATSVSDDGLTYTWNLEYGEVNEINYSFTMSSFPTTLVIGVIVGLIIVIVVILIVKNSKGKNSKVNNNMPMPNMDTNNSNNPVSMNNNFSNSSPIKTEPINNINADEINSDVNNNIVTSNNGEASSADTSVASVPVDNGSNFENQPPIISTDDNQNS